MSMLACEGRIDLKRSEDGDASNDNSSRTVYTTTTGIRRTLHGFIQDIFEYFSLTDEQALRLRQIRELQAKDDHLLLDIGLTRDEIEAAMTAPRWAPEDHPQDGATRIRNRGKIRLSEGRSQSGA